MALTCDAKWAKRPKQFFGLEMHQITPETHGVSSAIQCILRAINHFGPFVLALACKT